MIALKNSNKIFITKALAFVVFFFLIDFGSGILFRFLTKMALENNPQGMIAEYTMQEVEADILIIGGSDAHSSFVPDIIEAQMNLSCYNCGLDGHGIFYQCCLINSILQRTTPKFIIWCTDPRFLTGRTKGIPETLYRFYDQDLFVKNMIDKIEPKTRFLLYSNLYCYNSTILNILKNILSKTNSTKGYNSLETEGYLFPSIREPRMPANEVMDVNVRYFEDIIHKCNDKGVKLVMVFPPRYEEFNYKEGTEFKALEKITEEQNILFVHELYLAPEFINDSSMFKDAAHVNDKGARMFTTMFCERIKCLN